MSALASGFEGAEEFYKVIAPTPADLGGPAIGKRYWQKTDINWIPNRSASTWVVTNFKNGMVTIQPDKARWIRGTRKVKQQILKTEYKLCRHQRQRLLR